MTDTNKDEDYGRFDVSVWNHEGDVIESLWSATIEELEELQDKYEDDPLCTVVWERR